MKRIVFLAVFSLLFLTGCHGLGGGVVVRGEYSQGYNTLPAHAPAYGRRNHRYYYYPNAEFYFDIDRNLYFYLDSRAQWAFSVTLPLRLRPYLRNNYIEIEMDDDRPYRRHKYYRNKYKKHNSGYKRNDKAKHRYKKSKRKYKKHHGDDDDEDRHNRGR